MAKVSKSFRVDEDTLERVRARMSPGETESAAMVRILETGLDALDGVEPPSYEAPDTGTGAADADVVAELRARVDALEEENGRLWKQLETKDQQIERAQQTTALATQSATRRRGLLGWLLGDRYNDNR